jgi:hypothetical protein
VIVKPADTKDLDALIDRILEDEAVCGPNTMDSVREELDDITYPDVVVYIYSLKEIASSLAHRVRELEAESEAEALIDWLNGGHQ